MLHAARRLARRLLLALVVLLLAVVHACRAHEEGELARAHPNAAEPIDVQPPTLVPEFAGDVTPCTTGTVKLIVVDPDDALRIERFDVRVRRADGMTEERHSPIGGVVAGLAPSDYTFDVTADGRAPCTLDVAALAAGETRELTALVRRRAVAAPAPDSRSSPSEILSIAFLDADEVSPLADVRVLFRHLFAGPGTNASVSSSHGSTVATAVTDVSGRAAFLVVRGDTYDILARRSDLCVRNARIDVPLTGPLELVRIVFAAAGRIEGRLVCDVPVDFAHYALEFAPTVRQASVADAEEFWWAGLDEHEGDEDDIDLAADVRSVVARVDADGSFRVGPLPAGDARVTLLWSARDDATGRRGANDIELESSMRLVAHGEQRWTIELGEHAPGELAIECALGGDVTEQLSVELFDTGPHTWLAAFELEARGRTSIPFPAGRYRLRVRSHDDSWAVTLPDEVGIVARETTRVACSVALADGELVLVDAATRAPLAGVRVRVHDSESVRGTYRTTGARGELALRLPPDRYHACIDDERWADVSFDWRADDAARREVAVRRLRP